MIAWEEFLPSVLLEVDDCPTALAVAAIRNSAIEFCQRTRVWREYIDPINVVTGMAGYELDNPSNSTIVTVLSARCGTDPNKVDLKGPFSERRLDTDLPGWRNFEGNLPNVFLYDGNLTITLVPKPTEDITNGLDVYCALKPDTNSADGPELLLNHYHEAIGYGAKYRLMAMPEKEWSNATLAAYNLGQFQKAIVDAWSKVNRGNGQKDMRVNDQSFGGINW